MKSLLPYLLLLTLCLPARSQITIPIIKAGFGVDGEVRANFFNGFNQAGNDDWFATSSVVSPGLGTYIIDTTGASYILSQYNVNPAYRQIPFFRGMRYEQFSVVNGKLLIDGIFIRDHHGDDSTVFASGSNKNGMSPGTWTTPVSQGIPDKNDILDMFMHVRRDGVNLTDSMWLFGAVSINNTTGSRYFDFEMYQTDIYYDKNMQRFYGYGPDAGHTSWKFDASGNILQAGDIIFTAEFNNSGITTLEARIWINGADLAVTPVAFNWGGSFDGASSGATYGYANIAPKVAGDFYTGLQCANNTWAGPFALVLQNNSVVNNYTAKQLMEFSVNLTKLGLDPLVTSNDPCKLPFRRILVKSRASASFTAELKDFVGPFSFFRAPRAQAAADIPLFCGSTGVATIQVSNPVHSSLYTWHAVSGNITSDTIGYEITVDQPGIYVVSQQLMDSCGTTYATDTVVIASDPNCVVLKSVLKSFDGKTSGNQSILQWGLTQNESIRQIIIERSYDNKLFTRIGDVKGSQQNGDAYYSYKDIPDPATAIFYRLRMIDKNGISTYSKIIALNMKAVEQTGIKIMPNPVRTQAFLTLTTDQAIGTTGEITISNAAGVVVRKIQLSINSSSTIISLDRLDQLPGGLYIVKVKIGTSQYVEKLYRTL